MSFIVPYRHKTRAYNHRKCFQFLNRSYSFDPHVWLWVLGNGWKSAISSASGGDGNLV